MFGLGFMEIVLILIVAILFLGPDKLPKAMVEIAKFIKSFKKGVHDAKSVIDEELKIVATDDLRGFKNIDLGLDEILEEKPKAIPIEPKRENITFEKKPTIFEEPKATPISGEIK